MNDRKCFIDTNILLYCYAEDHPEKRTAALHVATRPYTIISTQVIKEACNILRKKFRLSWENIREVVAEAETNNDIVNVNLSTLKKAVGLAEKYQFQWFDAIIVASALESGCEILFTEDLHHGLVVEQMEICNPFKIV